MSDAHSLHHYFMLRGAMLRHEKLPWQLSDAEQTALARSVAREEQLVSRVLALPESREATIDDAELQRTLYTFLDSVTVLGEVEDVLSQAGLKQPGLQAALATEMVVAEVLERVSATLSPSEAEALQWYETHPEKFTVPERREVFQILVTISDEFAENSRELAWQRIAEVAQRLQAAPQQFAALALSHSECPSAVESGRLGVVPAGQLYPELDQVLFNMESDTVSCVVESPLGFHLLRCGAIEPAHLLAWEEVREELMQRLTQQRLKRYLEQRH